MSFTEKPVTSEDPIRTELRRTLFEMCYERVDSGDLRPEEVPAKVEHMLSTYTGERAPHTSGRVALSNMTDRAPTTIVGVIDKTQS